MAGAWLATARTARANFDIVAQPEESTARLGTWPESSISTSRRAAEDCLVWGIARQGHDSEPGREQLGIGHSPAPCSIRAAMVAEQKVLRQRSAQVGEKWKGKRYVEITRNLVHAIIS